MERQRGHTFAPAFGWSIRAAVAHLRDDRASALRYLERAEGEFTRSGMMLHVAAVAYRRGQLLGGDAGAALVARAEGEFRERAVRNPARFVEVYAPGFRVRAASPGTA